MSNSVGSSTPQAPASSSVVSPQSGGARERLQRHTQGIFQRFFTIPDRHPRMRVVFDIAIIALSLIAIISILAVTQGQGLLLYGLIPSALVGVFGVTLLISDLATSERLQRVADTATAILLPLIVLGIATALIASACLSAGGTALLLANPQFIMGVVTIGLFFISLSKVSCAHIKRELLDTTKKTRRFRELCLQSQVLKMPKRSPRKEKLLFLKKICQGVISILRRESTEDHEKPSSAPKGEFLPKIYKGLKSPPPQESVAILLAPPARYIVLLLALRSLPMLLLSL
ncbi:IncV family inclusion membrane protein [Chlamydia pecorum]|uniref:IncV family inclusion membrane protein n=1 Tax=Chlamydia pecorum TaxID=85991 RepID=UPI001E3FB860|nr:IncV family inclusion membrane protein [Chlamydia pecorum]UFP07135.1 IncV family inclusion membrane protein [Chlamydia pecorum]